MPRYADEKYLKLLADLDQLAIDRAALDVREDELVEKLKLMQEEHAIDFRYIYKCRGLGI